ncbi:hypothetical protein Aab01nite_22630 [Paractinoplanes abujensis]|nr:hypothetical protein Aab01nite_22630 [Actinoplanes abujensis]
MNLTEGDADGALLCGDRKIGLGEIDQLTEGIRVERPILGNAYNSAYHHPVSHILPTEHVSPPPAVILGSATVAGGPRGVALEGKTRDLHHR